MTSWTEYITQHKIDQPLGRLIQRGPLTARGGGVLKPTSSQSCQIYNIYETIKKKPQFETTIMPYTSQKVDHVQHPVSFD